MRVSVPTIPHAILSNARTRKTISQTEAINRISVFLAPGNALVLTGAGVSVDSGIRAYRGADGRYMNPNYKPIFFHELVDETEKGHAFRQRYWLRSYLGYPPVRDAQPNTTHFALAALQYTLFVTKIITQNVDGLHHKALRHVLDKDKVDERILELHGTLHKVHCKYGHLTDRQIFQDWLSAANPRWAAIAADLETSGTRPRTNPDGDIELDSVSFEDFVVPECPLCRSEKRTNSVHKPGVTFFGESIPSDIRDHSFSYVEQCGSLLILGTTLATFSAFRLLKRALELRKPVLMLNTGPTRADNLAEIEKIELPSGSVMPQVVRTVVGPEASSSLLVREMLSSGVVVPPT